MEHGSCTVVALTRADRVRITFSETVVSHFDISGESLAKALIRIDPDMPTSMTDLDIMSDPKLSRRIMEEVTRSSYHELDGHQVLMTSMEAIE